MTGLAYYSQRDEDLGKLIQSRMFELGFPGLRDAAECAQRMLLEGRLHPAVHYYLALILESLGIVDESKRSLSQPTCPDSAALTAGAGITVTGLKALAKMHQKNSSRP